MTRLNGLNQDERNTTMRVKPMMLITLTFLLLLMTGAAVALEHQEHSLKTGKKGEITLAQPTKVGDRWLLPDTYIVQHRSSGGDHFVRFVELKKAQAWSTEWNVIYTEPDAAGEIKCHVETAAAPVKQTTVSLIHDKGGDRITKVAIQGEDVVHVF
jgi:hypothetical protein